VITISYRKPRRAPPSIVIDQAYDESHPLALIFQQCCQAVAFKLFSAQIKVTLAPRRAQSLTGFGVPVNVVQVEDDDDEDEDQGQDQGQSKGQDKDEGEEEDEGPEEDEDEGPEEEEDEYEYEDDNADQDGEGQVQEQHEQVDEEPPTGQDRSGNIEHAGQNHPERGGLQPRQGAQQPKRAKTTSTTSRIMTIPTGGDETRSEAASVAGASTQHTALGRRPAKRPQSQATASQQPADLPHSAPPTTTSAEPRLGTVASRTGELSDAEKKAIAEKLFKIQAATTEVELEDSTLRGNYIRWYVNTAAPPPPPTPVFLHA
jgi:hypothetical protein